MRAAFTQYVFIMITAVLGHGGLGCLIDKGNALQLCIVTILSVCYSFFDLWPTSDFSSYNNISKTMTYERQ